jgi:hypothetical protein
VILLYIINKRFPKWEEENGIIVPKLKTKYKESIHIDGVYKFHSITNGIKKQIDEKHNTIMTDVFYRIVRAFLGYSFNAYYYISYCAIGSDNTAVTASDTTLGAEEFRTPYVAITNPTTSSVDVTFYITTTEFSGTIEEIGIFGGGTATDTADTGNLISHALWSYSKSVTEELLIEYTITLS